MPIRIRLKKNHESIWSLRKIDENSFYLKNIDGMVPFGQAITRKTAIDMFEKLDGSPIS